MDDDGPWSFYMENGALIKQRPWCDCEHKAARRGFTKRDDGAWVRPCCMRRERAAWEKHGDGPIKHDPDTCKFCQEGTCQIETGSPVSSGNRNS